MRDGGDGGDDGDEEMGVPFKENVCVAIIASDDRRHHNQVPKWKSLSRSTPHASSMAQTVQKRKRQPDNDDDDRATSSANPKRPKPSTARKSTGGGPPVASSSRDKLPREHATRTPSRVV